MEYFITTETRGAVPNEANVRLDRVYEPKKVAMVAGFHLHWHQQQPGESVAMYLAELRKLAEPCESLDEALHDRLGLWAMRKNIPKGSAVRARTDTRQDNPAFPEHGDHGREYTRTARF